MSNVNSVAKKTVKIKESHLVDLIDNIVNEAVAVKKQEWINEQATKNAESSALLESKIAALEAKVNRLTEGKK
ncbi:MAG: hypothetical protein E6R13_09335 [Spirochaetes bacterium]|nr:MAG: hypothetical protein E6R13_09335 [Spirochaetota bacterium]